jgi:hypothetical protein
VANNCHNFCQHAGLFEIEKENPMRTIHVVFAGAFAAALTLTAPALAKNSDAQRSEDKPTSSSSCSAYQQAPDGSWAPLPCKETGERDQLQTRNRTSQQGADRGER